MSKQPQKVTFDFDFVIPAEMTLKTAKDNLGSSDENVRAVAKAIVDVTREATRVQESLRADGNIDLAPYFDFWFADAVAAANKLLNSGNENIRYMAKCLIEQEQAILKSKRSFLDEMKRRGIRPRS
jgi:hypothetical protein